MIVWRPIRITRTARGMHGWPWHDSCVGVTWRIHEEREGRVTVTRLDHRRDMTHAWLRYDTWLIHELAPSDPQLIHECDTWLALACDTWLVHACNDRLILRNPPGFLTGFFIGWFPNQGPGGKGTPLKNDPIFLYENPPGVSYGFL